MNKPEGIIFDCDGCILDSEPIFLEVITKYLKKFEIETAWEDLKFVLGKSMKVITRDIIQKFSLNIAENEFIKEEREGDVEKPMMWHIKV